MAKQITEEQIEQIIEKLINRMEKANAYFLQNIGSSIKKIRELTPTQAQQLAQMLKYGGNYEDMIKEIAKFTNLNVRDIDNIFYNYAKKDQQFYKTFYKYRDKPFIPFDQNQALKTQTRALSNIVKNEMYNFTRSNVLGYTINGQFYNLRETYNQLLDQALLNVNQGKETFDAALTKILKDIGGSGLRTIEYESGRSVRLDSVARMHLKSRLRELHNENQKIIGEEIDYDGIEISVHANPAPDHEEAQGRQFTIDKKDKDGKVIKKGEFEKLQEKGKAKTYDGIDIDLHLELKNNETAKGFRPISEMNCYHYIFSIVLGVSKPQYTDKQLQQIIDDNNKGFEFEGKHYTNYEGTQLQRQLERKIREQKDTQILAKASDTPELIADAQSKITVLTKKYKELSQISGLPTKMQRLRVAQYKRVAKSKLK